MQTHRIVPVLRQAGTELMYFEAKCRRYELSIENRNLVQLMMAVWVLSCDLLMLGWTADLQPPKKS